MNPILELTNDFKMTDLVETISEQWSEDEIFEFIKELEEEVATFEFTKRLRDYFQMIYEKDLKERIDTAADDELAGAVDAIANIKYKDVESDAYLDGIMKNGESGLMTTEDKWAGATDVKYKDVLNDIKKKLTDENDKELKEFKGEEK
jgi:hypothetical protein